MRPDLRADDPPQEAQPSISIPARHLEGDLVASLMRRHQVAAERLIGWLRVAIGICVIVTVIADHVLSQFTGLSLDLYERNAWIAALGSVTIGAVSISLAVPQRWHHGLAYVFMVLDVALVLGIAFLG